MESERASEPSSGYKAFISADLIPSGKVLSGFSALEHVMGIGSGIACLRSRDGRWLSRLCLEMMARNVSQDRKVLLLSWADQHRMRWALDHDALVRIAKEAGTGIEHLEERVLLSRAFSKESNDEPRNWEHLMRLEGLGLIILDSVCALHVRAEQGSDPSWERGRRDGGAGSITKSIGRFVKLCLRTGCVGVALDRAEHPSIHPYLAHVSSVIVEFTRRGSDIRADLIKHPFMGDRSEHIPRRGQYTLWRWL